MRALLFGLCTIGLIEITSRRGLGVTTSEQGLLNEELITDGQVDLCNACNLTGLNLKDFDLKNAQLTCAKLNNADLSKVFLGKANLAGANLRGADLSGANLGNANLKGAQCNKKTVLPNSSMNISPSTCVDLCKKIDSRSCAPLR